MPYNSDWEWQYPGVCLLHPNPLSDHSQGNGTRFVKAWYEKQSRQATEIGRVSRWRVPDGVVRRAAPPRVPKAMLIEVSYSERAKKSAGRHDLKTKATPGERLESQMYNTCETLLAYNSERGHREMRRQGYGSESIKSGRRKTTEISGVNTWKPVAGVKHQARLGHRRERGCERL